MSHPAAWYDPLRWSNTKADPLVTDSSNLHGHDEWDFMQGKRIVGWRDTAWLASSDYLHDGEPDDVLQNHLGLHVFSERLRDALTRADIGGIQYLPVDVRLSDGQVIEGFAIANILAMISAFDFKRSNYDVFPDDYFLPERRGLVRAIRKPVLIKSAIAEYDVFRLAEYDIMHFVSDRFKHVFEAGEFTGYAFSGPIALS